MAPLENNNAAAPGTNNMMNLWDLKWWNSGGRQGGDSAEQDKERNWPKRQISLNDPTMDQDALKVAAKQSELQSLLQQIYQAEAAVKMETGEVTRTQQVALEAEQALEEATNKVRMLSADLQNAQEAAAQAAMRAHTAQLQLSAHDQLMFTARQRVDALSAQMVSVQADLAAAQQLFTLTNSSQHLEQQAHALQLGEPIDSLQPMPSEVQFQPNSFYVPGDSFPSAYQNKYPWLSAGMNQYAPPNLQPEATKHSNLPYVF